MMATIKALARIAAPLAKESFLVLKKRSMLYSYIFHPFSVNDTNYCVFFPKMVIYFDFLDPVKTPKAPVKIQVSVQIKSSDISGKNFG